MNNFIRYGSPAIKLFAVLLFLVIVLFTQYECSKVVNTLP